MKNKDFFKDFKFNSDYGDIKNAIKEAHLNETLAKKPRNKLRFGILSALTMTTGLVVSFFVSFSITSSNLKQQKIDDGYIIKVPNSIKVLETEYFIDLETDMADLQADELLLYIIPSRDYLKEIEVNDKCEITIDDRVETIIEAYSIVDILVSERILIKSEIELFSYASK